MEHREYKYIGEYIPEICKENHADFIAHYQKSILLSLLKRNLITLSQYEQCLDKLNIPFNHIK